MMIRSKKELHDWHKEQALWIRKRMEHLDCALADAFNPEEAVDLEAKLLKLAEEAELHESAAEVLKERKDSDG